MYFYNTQTCIFTTLKTEQQYLNIATKWPLVAHKKKNKKNKKRPDIYRYLDFH